MSLSSFAKEVVDKLINKLYSKNDDGTISYSLEINSSRADPDVFTTNFKFKKPIPEADLEKIMPDFINILSTNLSARRLGVIGAILGKAGIDPESIGKSTKVMGSLPIRGTGKGTENIGSLLSIRTKSGRFIGIEAFKGLVSLLMKPYIVKDMVSPSLVYRTGRFVASTYVSNVQVYNSPSSSLPILEITFGYQMYPYHTFDPAGPNGLGLATPERNPRKIIGEAITKVLDDLVSSRQYNIRINQL